MNPAPKPPRKSPKPRRPLLSEKPIKRSGKIKPKPRSPEEYARIYGSPERVEWVKSLPCVTTWHDDWWKFRGHHTNGRILFGGTGTACKGKKENAHIVSGGTGRKADAHLIVPACHHHHAEMHRGVQTFEARYGVDLNAAAEQIEAKWQAWLRVSGTPEQESEK